jgi:hypothetical protein
MRLRRQSAGELSACSRLRIVSSGQRRGGLRCDGAHVMLVVHVSERDRGSEGCVLDCAILNNKIELLVLPRSTRRAMRSSESRQ